MVQKLSEIKAESGRDLDSLVDENLLIPAETGAGTFGVLRFFQGIKNFFKGISALGTLSSTGRIPTTDANGNVNYVTPQQILDAVSTINGDKNFANNVSVAGALNVNGENLYDTLSQYAKINSLGIQYHRVYAGNHNANIVDLNLVSGIYHLVGFQAEKMFDMYYYCNGNTASYCATTQNMNILGVDVNQIYINTALDWLVVDIIA